DRLWIVAPAWFDPGRPTATRSEEEITMRGPGFIHLHVHSAFSLLEGALQLENILKLAVQDAQPAIGIADTNNLFGALEFSEKAAKKGLQPLIGVELAIDFAAAEERVSERGHVAWAGKSSVVL